MAKFDYDKKGYNTGQVDSYIAKLCLGYENKLAEQKNRIVALKNENKIINESLGDYKQKDNQITKALILAVEKAEQYEKSKKRIYDLELKRVKLLYEKFFNILNVVQEKYVSNDDELTGQIDSLKSALNEIINSKVVSETTTIKEDLKKSNLEYIKNILNKMDYMVTSSNNEKKESGLVEEDNSYISNVEEKESIIEKKPSTINENKNLENIARYNDSDEFLVSHDKENNRLASIGVKLNNILNKSKKTKEEVNYVDEFLNSSDTDEVFGSSRYAKKIVRKRKTAADVNPFNFEFPEPNESGFDFKEALNPKDDLDTIMKEFDFSNKE